MTVFFDDFLKMGISLTECQENVEDQELSIDWLLILDAAKHLTDE